MKNTLPAYLRAFILNKGKWIMNKFIRKIGRFHINNIYYTDTDSLYVDTKYCDVVDKAGPVGGELCQG